jgi:hypothetical protein
MNEWRNSDGTTGDVRQLVSFTVDTRPGTSAGKRSSFETRVGTLINDAVKA